MTSITGEGKVDPEKFVAWAKENGALRTDDLEDYVNTVWWEAPKLGLNPDVVLSQALVETSDRATGTHPFTSVPWTYGLNPAGIGVTDDSQWRIYDFRFGQKAALAQLLHLYRYTNAGEPPEGYDTGDDPRWDAAAHFAGIAATVGDLANRWAIDPAYGDKIEAKLRLMERAGLLSGTEPQPEEPMPFTKPYVIVVAGHRSTGDPGDPVERGFTDDLAIAYRKAFRDAGYKCDWWQADLDKDSDPTMTQGSLDTVAKGVGKAVATADADLVLMYDLHFDGANSVVHAIPPDCVGLRTAYANGAPAVDTAANNTLDTNLAAEITAEISKATGISLYPARRLGIKGVMSERDTRVGEQGYRLAMLAATAPVRMKAARMVIEHAGYNQMTRVNNWAAVCANAAVKATTRVLEARGGPVGGDPGGGQPEPPSDVVPPLPIPVLEPFIKAGTLVGVPPPYLEMGSDTYIFTPLVVRATKETKRRQKATDDSGVTGIPIREGETFPVLFMYIPGDESSKYWITGWLTRVLVDDTAIVLEDAP